MTCCRKHCETGPEKMEEQYSLYLLSIRTPSTMDEPFMESLDVHGRSGKRIDQTGDTKT